MARTKIQLNYLVYDATDSVGYVAPTPTNITADGITVEKAFAGKDDSVKLVVTNSGEADGTMTIKAGDKQNACLGDSTIALGAGEETIVAPLRDMARYEKADGSIDIDFSDSFSGTIYAIAEKAGLE